MTNASTQVQETVSDVADKVSAAAEATASDSAVHVEVVEDDATDEG